MLWPYIQVPCSGASTTPPSLRPSCPRQQKGNTGCGHLHRHPLPANPAVVSSHRQRLSGAIPHHRGGRTQPSTSLSQPREASRPPSASTASTAVQVAIQGGGWHGAGGGWGETSGCATLWGVVWSTEARILPMVPSPPPLQTPTPCNLPPPPPGRPLLPCFSS